MLTKEENSVNCKRSPPRKSRKSDYERELDKTQESEKSRKSPESSSPEFRVDKQKEKKKSRSKSGIVILSSYSSRRVKYKKTEDDDRDVNIDKQMANANDRTLRDEDWFLEKIEKVKSKRLTRTCVCPMTRCWRLKDMRDAMRVRWGRVRRIVFVTCCPPFCCFIQRSAFWPPPREYYFFQSPPDDVHIEVNDEKDAIRMEARKKRLTKVKRAAKCVLGERYRFGLAHPCTDDIEHVEGFAVKTSRRNRLGCVFIPCPDGQRARFTLLYSHPNGSDLSDHLVGVPSLLDVARFYRCDVYSYDYSGYGISGGTPTERNLYADIRAVYEYITVERRVAPEHIVLLGYSIGSAATVELVRHETVRKPAGVILQAPPTSILRVFGDMLGRKNHLDTPSCCLDRFRTVDKIHEIQIPILIIHGKEDRIVPIEHGQLLCERAVNKVAPEWVPGAAHDAIENCREVWRRIRRFVKIELKLRGDAPAAEKAAEKDKDV